MPTTPEGYRQTDHVNAKRGNRVPKKDSSFHGTPSNRRQQKLGADYDNGVRNRVMFSRRST